MEGGRGWRGAGVWQVTRADDPSLPPSAEVETLKPVLGALSSLLGCGRLGDAHLSRLSLSVASKFKIPRSSQESRWRQFNRTQASASLTTPVPGSEVTFFRLNSKPYLSGPWCGLKPQDGYRGFGGTLSATTNSWPLWGPQDPSPGDPSICPPSTNDAPPPPSPPAPWPPSSRETSFFPRTVMAEGGCGPRRRLCLLKARLREQC